MGLFSSSAKKTDLDELRRQIVSLSARLDDATNTNDELKQQLQSAQQTRSELDARIDELTDRIDSAPAPAAVISELPAPTQKTSLADQAVVDELRLRIGKLQTRVDDMDARVTAATTELSNQINEISDDLERGADDGGDGEQAGNEAVVAAVDELRESQVRLANEQARYQIAFREDLAALAERVKR